MKFFSSYPLSKNGLSQAFASYKQAFTVDSQEAKPDNEVRKGWLYSETHHAKSKIGALLAPQKRTDAPTNSPKS